VTERFIVYGTIVLVGLILIFFNTSKTPLNEICIKSERTLDSIKRCEINSQCTLTVEDYYDYSAAEEYFLKNCTKFEHG
jgi:hypothetical protein